MTCIVAITDGKKVYMAGDTAGVGGFSISRRKDPKVGKVGKFVFGFTSSFRMGQILLYDFKPPKIRGKDLYEYMVVDFTKALREALKDKGFATVSSGTESGGVFLVGLKGRLFCVESDYQISESQHDFMAVGCGRDLALGSLYTTRYHEDITPEERLTVALDAACEFSAGVCSPYTFASTEN